jgi:hypothetical protein
MYNFSHNINNAIFSRLKKGVFLLSLTKADEKKKRKKMLGLKLLNKQKLVAA